MLDHNINSGGAMEVCDAELLDAELLDCFRKILNSVDKEEVIKIWNKLEEMEHLESGSKNSTYDCNRNYDKLLRTLLTESVIRNVWELSPVLEWFSKFPFPNTASNPISDDIASCLTKSAENFKDDYNLSLVAIIQMIESNEQIFLLPHNNHTQLCKAIVEVLSWMHVPEALHQIRSFNDGLMKIKGFLKMICKNKAFECPDNISLTCFMQLCRIFLKSNRSNPSSALIIVLQLVDVQLWKEFMLVAVNQIISECKDDHSRIVTMLSLFCTWLTQPSQSSNMEYLSTWLKLFMNGLEHNNKRGIPMEVAENALPRILTNCLRSDKFYYIDINDNVILHLLHVIGSLDLCHAVMRQMILFFKTLDRSTLKLRKVEVIRTIISIIEKLLKRFSQHLENNSSECGCEALLKLTTQFVEENNHGFSSYIHEENEEMEVSYPSTSSGVGRVDTSKVGLQNLGNTCYMNSVLQALAMTRQFCHEVLLYKTTKNLRNQTVLKNLQNLFALLKYPKRNSLAPTEILRACRPEYFTVGQQQDSSEFLCHLLDVMYEQEKSALEKNTIKSKLEDKHMEVVEEEVEPPINDDGTSKNMTRWTTEENLSEGASLQRKTQSLADFTQGEELAQTQNGLSDSHSDSTDSGIQSVGGEDSTSSASSSTSGSPSATSAGVAATPSLPAAGSADADDSSMSYLVHRVFGGELKIIYQCCQCATESHNTDRFRDLQLCFLDSLAAFEQIKVQELININYLSPEDLTGDNKYRCDKCAGLVDAQRIIKILQAPAHLILTLKHFRYDSESGLRTKLRRKVIYDETVTLPVLDKTSENYKLYAAVVHSGYSMDYGHYITYACDAKNRWYKFNDSHVTQTSIDEFNRLEPPDTPYILFYRRCSDIDEEDAPDFASLDEHLRDYVKQDDRKFQEERRSTRLTTGSRYNLQSSLNRGRTDDDDDDDKGSMPPSSCKSNLEVPGRPYLF